MLPGLCLVNGTLAVAVALQLFAFEMRFAYLLTVLSQNNRKYVFTCGH